MEIASCFDSIDLNFLWNYENIDTETFIDTKKTSLVSKCWKIKPV